MQIAKKYFSESLIQLTILLSLIGVRVDIDSYLNGYYTPLIEINLGPSSAYTQTPFHSLRDNLDGYSVHPKCPELDYFFASRRLLEEVRTLGSPRFPTQLSAWLVHQVSANDEADLGSSTTDTTDNDNGSQGSGSESRDGGEHLLDREEDVWNATPELVQGPTSSPPILSQQDNAKVAVEELPATVPQLAHSSTFDPEVYSARIHPPINDIDQHWNSILSVSDLDDLDLVTDHQSDISTALSQDVSLHDAMVSRARRYESRSLTQQQRTLFQLESTDSLYLDSSQGSTSHLFSSVCNLTENQSQPRTMGCLDEAVFDHINQLGFEGLDCMDDRLMGCLESIDPQVLEDLDSDSGLSLEMSSGGPVSPEISSSASSSSFCADECGATGYSSEMDSLPLKNTVDDRTTWSTMDFSESVWHDHSYSAPSFFDQPLPHKAIKEEPVSDDEEHRLDARELSRDELRARALSIPYSVLQIVNMPVEEFLEVLDGHGFSSEQVTLLRDIRRRGKNKLAAQNCRKRKLDAITGLQEEVERLRAQRDRLVREKHVTAKTMGAVGQQIKKLTSDIISRLRDDSGQPLNPERFTLQCGASGRVVVQPVRQPAVSRSSNNKTDKRKKEKKQ
uniref:Nuclear factor erythroid-derived 2-like 3 n=1 Tax=Takifugu rubripes TaxID=31033 RepID=Q1KL07_TAKRU|nr:nuclear factor erythroid-derived 2-like 3 [Takifugu rubripes]